MNLGSIIGKFLGKTSVGWGSWLDTPAGKMWEDVGRSVYDELEEAKVNVHKRQIFFFGPQSAKLTINQSARRIVEKTGHGVEAVREHLMIWLEEAADSDNEERDEEVDMASEIAKWVNDIHKSAKSSR